MTDFHRALNVLLFNLRRSSTQRKQKI